MCLRCTLIWTSKVYERAAKHNDYEGHIKNNDDETEEKKIITALTACTAKKDTHNKLRRNEKCDGSLLQNPYIFALAVLKSVRHFQCGHCPLLFFFFTLLLLIPHLLLLALLSVHTHLECVSVCVTYTAARFDVYIYRGIMLCMW